MALGWAGVILTLLTFGLTSDKQWAEARPSGLNIDSACISMVPSHGVPGQVAPPPFSIEFNSKTYTTGNAVSVTIKACSSTAFRGFMIQARRATAGSNQDEAIGSFTPIAATQKTCGDKGLIHTNRIEKTTLTFDWSPPAVPVGPVQFRVTFVHQYSKFWHSVKSDWLLDSTQGTPDSSTLTPATTLASSCPMPLPDGNFPKDADCDESSNCFSDCGQDGCTFQVKFSQDGVQGEYSIKTKAVESQAMFAAVGFSSDQQLGRDSISGCIYIGSAQPFNAFSVTSTGLEDLLNDGVSLQSSSNENGIFSCTFKRVIAAGLSGKRYSLDKLWHLIFARGPFNPLISQFDINFFRRFSSNRYSLTGSAEIGQELSKATNPPQTTASASTAPGGLVNGKFVKDVDCDGSRNCHSDCGQDGCTFQVKFRKDGDDFGEYSIKTVAVGTSNMYAAVGFSQDQIMDKDSISGCIYRSGATEPFNAFSATKQHRPEMLTPDGLTVKSATYKNGIFSCTFQRAIATGLNGKRYDLSYSWFQLFAKGVYTDSMGYHRSDRQASAQRYSLTGSSMLGTELSEDTGATDPPMVGALELPSGCGTSKGCISQCSGSFCETVISWQDDSDDSNYVLYTLTSVVSSPSYMAIGLSSDDQMGADSVSGCATGSDNSVKIFTAVNGNEQSPDQFEDLDVTLKSSSLNDNVLSCTIRQPKKGSTNGKRFDVTKQWYILFARGESSINSQTITINYHRGNRFVSSGKFSSNDRPNAGAKNIDYPYVKAHGSLMIAAWVFLASIGIVAARYYKPVWNVDFCSQKVWFQIHRTCMILVFCCTVAGFVLIFVEVEGWSDLIEEDEYLETHPILGVIVAGLTILNPIMALCRPHPGTENRYIFNWAHWFVGTAAHILGVITIFFGVQLQKAQASDYVVYILAGYVGWQVLITLILELMQCYGKELARREVYEMDDLQKPNPPTMKETAKTSNAKRILLLVHIFVLTSVSAILIGFVCIGEDDLDN